jgi:thiosulfate dehydrogenase [quinone] large subunit
MKNDKEISRRTTLRGAMLLALTAVPALFTKESASAATTNIIKTSKLKVGATHSFTTAKQGIPAILFRTKTGVFAYSTICTHQGCSVTYNQGAKKVQCPCHGAQFDPLKGAKPTSGPAETPLASIKVAIKGAWVVEL